MNERIAELTGLNDELGVSLYVCECSDEACAESLELTRAEYQAVRANGARFVIAPRHEIGATQRVVEQNRRFAVVENLADARAIATNNNRRPA
jgi:hypothetical protein